MTSDQLRAACDANPFLELRHHSAAGCRIVECYLTGVPGFPRTAWTLEELARHEPGDLLRHIFSDDYLERHPKRAFMRLGFEEGNDEDAGGRAAPG